MKTETIQSTAIRREIQIAELKKRMKMSNNLKGVKIQKEAADGKQTNRWLAVAIILIGCIAAGLTLVFES